MLLSSLFFNIQKTNNSYDIHVAMAGDTAAAEAPTTAACPARLLQGHPCPWLRRQCLKCGDLAGAEGLWILRLLPCPRGGRQTGRSSQLSIDLYHYWKQLEHFSAAWCGRSGGGRKWAEAR